MAFENIQTRAPHDPLGPATPDAPEVDTTHPLDRPDAVARLRKLRDWWIYAQQAQSESRIEQDTDDAYYDHEQWTEEEKQELANRGQAPLVFNKIKGVIDWIIGTERRTRIDSRVLPREDGDVKLAGIKTEVMKYASDVSKAPFARSRAFADAAKVGVGWIETGIRSDPTDDPLYVRHESWRNVWYDPQSRELDLSDARFLFRARHVDMDIAEAMFPGRSVALQAASVSIDQEISDDEFFLGMRYGDIRQRRMVGNFSTADALLANQRQRVRLVEAWYRNPTRIRKLRGGGFHGAVFDPNNPAMAAALTNGHASTYDAAVMQIRVAIFTDAGASLGALLQDMPSPYRHNRFPLTPIWAYRKGRDNSAYGVIRGCRDPQDDLNKRQSKAQFILASRQIVADDDATKDWELLREEAARPDGILTKKRGAELRMETNQSLAAQHIELMQQDAFHIRESGGVTSENLGLDTNAESGKAILAKQSQGSMVTAELFDNYRLATQIQGEIQLALIEQFYDQPKVVRIVGSKGRTEFIPINQQSPDGERMNDITARQMDFLVAEQDYRETIRQAMFEQLFDMTSKLPPQIALNLLDVVVNMADLPDKDDLVARIRKLNGQKDPGQNEDEQSGPTPEEARQAKMGALAERKAMADTAKAEAEALKTRVAALLDAVKAAQQAMAVPQSAPIAQAILNEAAAQASPPAEQPPAMPA